MQECVCTPCYSQKYWWELNLAVEPKIAIERILVDLNLVVQSVWDRHTYIILSE